MKGFWKTVKGYVLWTYERGSLHYDLMVTLILLFIFLSPQVINYKDQPPDRFAHPIGVLVNPDGNGGFYYQIDARAVAGHSGAELESVLLSIIEPIAGEVRIVDYQALTDTSGRIIAYRVRVERP